MSKHQLFNHIHRDGSLAIPPAHMLDVATRLEVARLIGEADFAMHRCRKAAWTVSAMYDCGRELYNKYLDSFGCLGNIHPDEWDCILDRNEWVLRSAEAQRLKVQMMRAGDAFYALASYMDREVLPAAMRHGESSANCEELRVFNYGWVTYSDERTNCEWDPLEFQVVEDLYPGWVEYELPILVAAGHFPLSHLKRQWRAVDRHMVYALGKGRTLAELRRLDTAFYGQPRLGRNEAMIVPFAELVAMCDGHPQHDLPPETALFIASNNNSKRLRAR